MWAAPTWHLARASMLWTCQDGEEPRALKATEPWRGRLPGVQGSRAEAEGRGTACRAIRRDEGKVGRGQHRHISGTREDFRMVEGGHVTREGAAGPRGHILLMLRLLGSL